MLLFHSIPCELGYKVRQDRPGEFLPLCHINVTTPGTKQHLQHLENMSLKRCREIRAQTVAQVENRDKLLAEIHLDA